MRLFSLKVKLMPMEIFLDLKRKFLRKLVGKISRTSFPFLSGDSYKLKCDFKLSTDFAQELQKISTFKSNSFSIFCPVFLVNDVFECIMKHKEYDLRNFKLYIHNGDFKPDKLKMELLANRFERVYSVNWLGSREIAIPIPIGLENYNYYRNGIPGDFSKLIRLQESKKISNKINVLVSFNLQTNLAERTLALNAAKNLPGVKIIDKFIKPHDYQKLLLNSNFVISPPGNGSDCHRTWEALYLGAVPILLESQWPFSHLPIPVILVKEWNEMQWKISEFSKCENQFNFQEYFWKESNLV